MFAVNWLIRAREAFAEWRRRQRAYAELSALDDRALADIGLRRSEIPAIVEGFYEASRKREREPRGPVFDPRQARLAAGHRWLPPL
jgi:uncharacterized protein YjiS (DUF1127 family)